MKKLFTCLFIIYSLCAFAQHPSTDPRWSLVFADEFDDENYTQAHWKPNLPDWQYTEYNTNTGNCYFPNGQPSAMINSWTENITKQVIIINSSTGILQLKHKKVNPYTHTYHCNDGSGDVTTDFTVNYEMGAIQTKDSYRFTYGYYEMKYMLPSVSATQPNYDALGPAFYLWHDGQTFKHEIDVFENVYEGNNFTYTNCTHYFINNVDEPHPAASRIDEKTTDTWHTTAVNWTKEKVDFYFDGKLIRTETGWWLQQFENANMWLRIWIAAPPILYRYPDNIIPINSTTTLDDFSFYIDYVRVWQLDQNCATNSDEIICTTPTSANNTEVYKSVTTGGSCNTTFNTETTIKATRNIVLGENTTLTSDHDLIFEVDDCMDY